MTVKQLTKDRPSRKQGKTDRTIVTQNNLKITEKNKYRVKENTW